MGKQLKAQVSMEFVFLIALAFAIMLVFVSSTRSEFDGLRSQEEKSLVKDVTVKIQQELIIASAVEDGYLRTFFIPATLNQIDYTVKIINNTLIVNTSEYEYVLNIPSVIGIIQKGNNTINKTNSTIHLN